MAIGVLVTALIVGSGDDDPTTAAGPSSTPPSSSSPSPTVSAAQARQAVADYYALLPDSRDAAWERLGPELRAEGRETFDDRWSKVRKLEVLSEPRMTGDDSVHVGLRMRMRDDSTVTEFHQHELVRLDGTVLLRTDTVLHSETTAPPKDDKDGDDKDEDDKKDKKAKDKKKEKDENGKDKRDEDGGDGDDD